MRFPGSFPGGSIGNTPSTHPFWWPASHMRCLFWPWLIWPAIVAAIVEQCTSVIHVTLSHSPSEKAHELALFGYKKKQLIGDCITTKNVPQKKVSMAEELKAARL